ncbi:MAG TPA: hypothetical protein VH479_21235 [Acidimicrobiales bacterium]
MTSDDRFPNMADIDAELERLLSGGSPSAESPAWFGDVAVLVRTARAPARPDELAGEADIVARMVDIRRSVLADAVSEDSAEVPAAGQDGDDAEAPPGPAGLRVNGHAKGVNGHANGTAPGAAARVAATDDQTGGGQADGTIGGSGTGSTIGGSGTGSTIDRTDSSGGTGRRDTGGSGTDGGEVDGEETAGAIAARVPGGPTAREPMEERLRERMSLAELDEYRAKHGGERYYVAKHAAPETEEPPHAVARTVGRVIAMKAVAITTAAALGVAAAAAATTGIVANVVVPAFNEHFQRPVPTSESPEGHKGDDDGNGSGSSRGSRSPSVSIVTCDESVLTPCVPSPLNSVATDPVTGATLVAPTTTAPDSTSTSVPGETTTSTTVPPTTGTSEPDPSTTETPTTASVDPQSLNP